MPEPALSEADVVGALAAGQPQLSPDGTRLVYRVAPLGLADGDRTPLWLAAVAGDRPPRQLTAGTGSDQAPRWCPGGQAVYFLADPDGGETAQLHRVEVAGYAVGAVTQLTRWTAGVEGFAPIPGPDGGAGSHRLAVWSRDPSTSDDELPARLRLVDLDADAVVTVATLANRHVVHAAARPDGAALAVLTWSSPRLDPGTLDARLHLVDVGTGQVRDLGPAAAGFYSTGPTWRAVGDGWHVCYVAQGPPSLAGGLALFDVGVPPADRPPGPHRNLTAGAAFCPAGAIEAGPGGPLVVTSQQLDCGLYRLDPADRLIHLADLAGEVNAVSASADGGIVAVLQSTTYQPFEVFAGPPDRPLTRITDTRAALRSRTWGTRQRLRWAVPGGERDGLLILPVGRGPRDGPFPTVVVAHGGPYDRHADAFQLGWQPSGQWLAAAGYAAFLPNPCGGRGHGYDFAAGIAGRAGTADWPEVAAGLDRLVADGIADPQRLGICGWSHGGFLAAWATAHTGRFRAAVAGATVADWPAVVRTSDAPHFEAALCGARPDAGDWRRAGELSPATFVASMATPLLLLHGAADERVPAAQAAALAGALTARGVVAQYVGYPGAGHLLRRREHQADALRRTREWFDRWL